MTAPDHATAIVIAAYNAATTLDRAVASALAQAECAELVIVDDASKDATLDIARGWTERDARVTVIAQPENGGPSAARNAAIAASSAPWLAIVDADDYLLPGRLAGLHKHTEQADFVADTLIRVAENAPRPSAPPQPETAQKLTFEAFLLGNLGLTHRPLDLGFMKPVFRRSFMEAHTLRYRADMRLGEDYELYARTLLLGARFFTTGPAGYVSVEQPDSLSKSHTEEDLRRLRDCDPDLAQLRALSNAERRALKRHWTSVDCRLQWRRLISAVKQRDAGAALSTFHTADATLYLAARLGEQAWLRSGAMVKRIAGA